MTETRVVHCRKEKYDVLIDRTTDLGNPFVIGRDGTRPEVIAKFRPYIWERLKREPELRRKVLMMEGQRLGCHCAPQPCHGHVYIDMIPLVKEMEKLP